jgi:hypothetical protein
MRARHHIFAVVLAAVTAAELSACSKSGGSGNGALAVAPATSAVPTTPTATAPASVPVVPVPAGSTTPLIAGAARVDITPPIGVPLAGYGGGFRRHSPLPNFNPFDMDHFLMPSTGVRDPINARALFVSDGRSKILIVTLDAIASTNEVAMAAWQKAQARGSSVPFESFMMCASHSHSGPGTLSNLWFWELTAADLFQQSVFDGFTDGIAQAIVEAERNAAPARIGAASGSLANATHNRRAGVSHVFKPDSIDPEVLVLRVDSASGAPIATLWNFAIHGICLGEDSHLYSADVMGGANGNLETAGAGVSLFVNSAEGDISPVDYGDPGIVSGGKKIADCVLATRQSATTIASAEVQSTNELVDFGPATLDATAQRLGSQGTALLQQNGWLAALQKLGVGPALGLKITLPPGWIETQFRFQALRIGKWGFASIPGEAIHTIGLDLKARGAALGFDHTFTCGLANGHMAYITTRDEYWDGGYEALATFWGDTQADKLEDSSQRQMAKIKP